jgi:hypothetical protein
MWHHCGTPCTFPARSTAGRIPRPAFALTGPHPGCTPLKDFWGPASRSASRKPLPCNASLLRPGGGAPTRPCSQPPGPGPVPSPQGPSQRTQPAGRAVTATRIWPALRRGGVGLVAAHVRAPGRHAGPPLGRLSSLPRASSRIPPQATIALASRDGPPAWAPPRARARGAGRTPPPTARPPAPRSTPDRCRRPGEACVRPARCCPPRGAGLGHWGVRVRGPAAGRTRPAGGRRPPRESGRRPSWM